ncbi:MAG: hypothetical protein H7831_11575 [Magnetococcus sp. WYHC-3]
MKLSDELLSLAGNEELFEYAATLELLAEQAKCMEEEKEKFSIIKVSKGQIPTGARLIEAYETEREYIILGTPPDESSLSAEEHNCDAMGCSFSHVVARIPKKESL